MGSSGAGFLSGFTRTFGAGVERHVQRKREEEDKERAARLDALRATLSDPNLTRDAKAVVLNDYIASLKGHKEAQQAWKHFQRFTKMGVTGGEGAPLKQTSQPGQVAPQQDAESRPRTAGPDAAPQRSLEERPRTATATGALAANPTLARKSIFQTPAEQTAEQWAAQKPEWDYKANQAFEHAKALKQIDEDKAVTVERLKADADAVRDEKRHNWAANRNLDSLTGSYIAEGVDPATARKQAAQTIIGAAKDKSDNIRSEIRSREEAHQDREQRTQIARMQLDIALFRAKDQAERTRLTAVKTEMDGAQKDARAKLNHSLTALQGLLAKKDGILNNANLTPAQQKKALDEVEKQIDDAKAAHDAAEANADAVAASTFQMSQQAASEAPDAPQPLSRKAKAAASGGKSAAPATVMIDGKPYGVGAAVTGPDGKVHHITAIKILNGKPHAKLD
jgi:hypothetical protein